MLSFEPSVVFIDDNEQEVNGIIELYREEGIGVKFYNANLTDGDNKPLRPFVNVNLIFLDLYYQTDFDVDLSVGWIDSIIPESSFYVLVIWSKDNHHRDEIVEGLSTIKKKPFLDFNESKSDYQKEDNTYNWESLKKMIDNGVEEVSELSELSIWKKSVLNSSNVIIGHLSKDSDSEKLKIKLQKIISGHGGTSFIVEGEGERKRGVLFDALDSVLVANTKGLIPNISISDANKDGLYDIPESIQGEIDSKLNSWFHFKLLESIDDKEVMPGLISLNNKQFLKNTYSIQDDEKIKSKIKPQADSGRTTIDDIVVVLMRSCDFAQGKYGKNIKLLSGIKITNPERYNSGKKNGELKLENRFPDSVKFFDHLTFIDGDDSALIFDFRYIFSIPPSIFVKHFENIKIFNRELLSELQVEYSSYSSRLGTTQII